MTTTAGAGGQFDVLLDGELIASREKGFLTRLFGGGWPEPDLVVEELKKRQQKAPA